MSGPVPRPGKEEDETLSYISRVDAQDGDAGIANSELATMHWANSR